jgi:GTP-binding protein Era
VDAQKLAIHFGCTIVVAEREAAFCLLEESRLLDSLQLASAEEQQGGKEHRWNPRQAVVIHADPVSGHLAVRQLNSLGSMTQPPEHFKSGFVAIVGRTNVGKSTLLNAALGVDLAIATSKPQTTRNRILGVHTEERGQVIFVDTPGIHAARDPLNRRMVDAAYDTMAQTDMVLFVVEAESLALLDRPPFWGGDGEILSRLKDDAGGRPVVLAVNKADRLKSREAVLPILERVAQAHDFDDIVVLSALQKRNVDQLVDVIIKHLPEGPPLYPADTLTDRAERFLAAEFLREQVLKQTEREVPYAVAVEIEQMAVDHKDGKLHIKAVIHVERASQKAIVIGKGGERIREIGRHARQQMQRFFGQRIHLDTMVRVENEWTSARASLDRFGYGSEDI